MRIAVLAAYQFLVGGAETYQRWVIGELLSRGHTLAYGCEFLAQPNDLRVDTGFDVPVWHLDRHNIAQVAEKLRKFAADVVFIQGLEAPELEAFLCEQFPCVLFAHGYHGTCLTGKKRHSLPVPMPCTRALGPACLGINYLRGCGAKRPGQLLREYLQQTQRQRNLTKFRAIVVASAHMAEEYVRNGIPRSRIHVLACPTPAVGVQTAPPEPRGLGNRLLFLGRLTDIKGLGLLLRALPLASQLAQREFELDVAGDGPQRAKFERLTRSLGARATFHGWCNDEEKQRLIQAADLLVVPSAWPEPFGLVGLEAGVWALPVAAFATGGIPDWLMPGINGEAASGDRYDFRLLAQAIARAFASETHHQRLRQGAWEMARRFTPAQHIRMLEGLFEQVREHNTAPGT